MKIIPVIIRNVNLKIDFQIDESKNSEQIENQLKILNKLKEKYGGDPLLDTLTTLLLMPGFVDNITIAGANFEKEQKKEPILSKAASWVLRTPRFNGAMVCQISPENLQLAITNDYYSLVPDDAMAIQDFLKERGYLK